MVKVIDKLCAYENVFALLFITPREKNLEQWEMMIEDNEQEHEATDKITEELNEVKSWVISFVKIIYNIYFQCLMIT